MVPTPSLGSPATERKPLMEPTPAPREGGFATRAVHGGTGLPMPEQSPISPGIWPAVAWSTERTAELGDLLDDRSEGYVYGRYDNPTNTALHAVVSSLHGAEAAWSLSSGTAAIHAALSAVRGGGAILATQRLYGGTFSLLQRLADQSGWAVTYADVSDPAAVREALTDDHTVVYVETIANPSTTVTDIAAIAAVCQDAGVALVVDNTFASPYLCRPLALGADLVVGSATKFLAGHGDVVAGVVAGGQELIRRVRETTYTLGGVLGPFEAWLVTRGIQTLPLRMAAACASAQRVADVLADAPGVVSVAYPGLADHPQHELAQRQFGGRGNGAVLSLDLGDRDRAEAFADALQVIRRVTSLGSTQSLVLHPASTSHRHLSESEQRRAGVEPGTVRLSIGIEDAVDLVADVRRALTVAAASDRPRSGTADRQTIAPAPTDADEEDL